jgi:hypothetical protein
MSAKEEAGREILEYRAAYRRCHGTEIAPPLLFAHGWVTFCGPFKRKVRRAQLREMTARLNARATADGPSA